ncbi:MAG: AraC family transcriptional regulator [Caulobacteraceae bacterium]
MDPLSDVLALLEARSYLSAALVTGGDWAMRFSRPRSVKFTAVIRGGCWLVMDGLPAPLRLEAGDCFLLNRSGCVLASDPALEPVPAVEVFAHAGDRTAHHGGFDDFHAIGGGVRLEGPDSGLLLDLLPSLIHVEGASGQAQALHWLIAQLAQELSAERPGASLTADHLAHLMFVQVLRTYLASEAGSEAIGWLGALADRRIGAAIRRLHAEPARRWTLEELATACGMSRSSFADRFKARVGVAPLDYLIRWRMRLAAAALRKGAEPVSAIAAGVGYESESAFSNAFKRVTGSSPLLYRRSARAA